MATQMSSLTDEPVMLDVPIPEGGEKDESDTASDVSDEDDDKLESTVRKKFDGIISRLKSGHLDLNDPTKLDLFMEENKSILSLQTRPKDQTLLHLIADTTREDLPVEKVQNLVTALVRLPSDLLTHIDSDGKTPLYSAIFLRNHKLAIAMCEAHPDVDSVLRVQPTRMSNCLHLAIKNKARSKDDELILFLIKHCGPETLCALDGETDMTPLHLAVSYARCGDAQLKIVQALVEKCDRLLELTYNYRGEERLSPYRYHEHTRRQFLERQALRDAKKDERKDESSLGSERRVQDGGKVLISSTQMSGISLPAVPTPSNWAAPRRMFDIGSIATVVAPGPNLRVNTSSVVGGASAGRTLQTPVARSSTKKPERKSKGSRSKPTEQGSLAIQEFLKLHYMRNKYHDDVVEFLYGQQQDRQIYFDLFGCGEVLRQSRLTDGLRHIELEDILQYVAVPQVRIEDNPSVTTKGAKKLQKQDIPKGRTDLRFLFNWLKDKKVKSVLKVIVDDLKEPAHSDEVIEDCLAGMGVEIWDWRKMDLCADVILKVAPDVREVHLYWSGNNAVLRGWGVAEGLRKLGKLNKVCLHFREGLETRARTQQYVEAFKERIQGDRIPQIQFEYKRMRDFNGDAGANGDGASRDPYKRHKWLVTMEEFAQFLQSAEHSTAPLALKHPIKVAIIDDGVDIDDQAVHSKIVSGRSFCHRDEEQNLNQPYYVSSGGHGTYMAGLICKICPSVQLYILKLDEHYIEAGKRQITAKSAAKAVAAALVENVDIISMSWTIEKTESNQADIAALEDAISDAARKNILMFCAATDQGAYKDRTYPAACNTKTIFKIGAAGASGAALEWLGDQSAVDFILPGHQVVMERQAESRVTNAMPTALTGSSVATALAAGLAAVVLYCVQIGCILKAERNQRKPTDRDLDSYRALKNHEQMRDAFQRIGTSKESEGKYITVWERFSKTVKKAESEPRDRWMNLVQQLAAQLKGDD